MNKRLSTPVFWCESGSGIISMKIKIERQKNTDHKQASRGSLIHAAKSETRH
jgi:hypothetical protein